MNKLDLSSKNVHFKAILYAFGNGAPLCDFDFHASSDLEITAAILEKIAAPVNGRYEVALMNYGVAISITFYVLNCEIRTAKKEIIVALIFDENVFPIDAEIVN